MTDQADNTIITRFLVEASDALAKHAEMKASVAEVKAQLKELAVQSNATYKEMAVAMTKAFSEQTFKEIGERVSKLSPIDMSAALKTETEKARAAIAEYKTVVASALQEVNAEVKNSDTIWKDSAQTTRVVRRDAAKEQEANAKQQVAALKYLEAEEKKAAAETKRLEQEKKVARAQATKEWLANNKQQAMAMRELDSSQKEHMGMLQSLGSVMRTVFGLSALTMVLNFFRSYTNALKEATEAGYEFVKGVYQLGVGVRALQRAGMDVSFAEVVESLQGLRDEYGIFSTKELVVGAAAFTNLIRDLRLTSEQFFTLQKAVASLAVVNGRSMDEVQRTVALALSSGYTEGLQRLGVSINRVTIAEEAARLGWEGGYTSLTEQQRAFATYNLIIKKTAVYMEELTTYQDTLAGKIDSSTAKLTDQKAALGDILLPFKLLGKYLEQVLYFLLQWTSPIVFAGKIIRVLGAALEYVGEVINSSKLGGYIQGWTDLIDEIRSSINIVETASAAIENFITKIISFVFKEEEDVQRALNYLREVKDIFLGIMNVEGTDVAEGTDTFTAEEALDESVQAAISDQLDAIEDAENDFREGSEEAWNDYLENLEDERIEHGRRLEEIHQDHNRRVEELEREHQRRIEELAIDHQRRLEDIELDYQRDLADLQLGLANDIADIWADYYNDLASAEADYRNKQIDAEVKYQETLLRLRENFLFDLEDALRERDARQVLQLIRRYNLEKDQAERDFTQEMDRLRREHEERMAELARQRDERLRQLYAEMEARRIALELQHQRELEDERRRFAQEQADEETKFAQEQEDEYRRWLQKQTDEYARYEQERLEQAERYAQELEDLQDHLDDRYEAIAEALGEELGYTATMMEAIRETLNNTLGPGGAAEAIYSYYTQMAINATAAAQAATAALLQLQGFLMSGNSITFTPGNKPGKDYANGGYAYADTATQVTFGEGGPEVAAFYPLSNPGAMDIPAPNFVGGEAGGGGGGTVSIEVLLDRYLEGRIVDNAVDSVANVVLRRFRQ